MPFQTAVNVVIVQSAQVVAEPLVPNCQEAEEGGLTCALAANQAEHHIKFASGLKYPANGTEHKQFHCHAGVIIHRCTQEFVERKANPFLTIPPESIQEIPDRMMLVFVGDNTNCMLDLLFIDDAVGFFQVEQQILHVGIRQCAALPLPSHGLYNFNALGK